MNSDVRDLSSEDFLMKRQEQTYILNVSWFMNYLVAKKSQLPCLDLRGHISIIRRMYILLRDWEDLSYNKYNREYWLQGKQNTE